MDICRYFFNVEGMHMDMKELKTFLTLSHTMSYQKAAELLNFAPSTLNRHIQLLEAEMGIKLFEKRGRWLEMTPEGHAFVEYARRMFAVYEEALNNIGLPDDRDENICIGGCEIVLAHCMMDLLSAFTRSHPHARLTMLTSANARVPEMVRNGSVEVAYYYTMDQEPTPGVHEVILFKERLCLAAAPDHPLASRSGLHYEDLHGVGFVFPHDDCCSAVTILHLLKIHNVRVAHASYLGAMQLMIDRVFKNQALLAAPESAIDHFARVWGVKKLDLAEMPVPMWARVVCRDEKKLTAAAGTLLHYSMQHASPSDTL